MTDQMEPRTILLCGDRAILSAQDDNGELVLQIPLPRGEVRLSDYAQFLPDGCAWALSGASAIVPKSSAHISYHPMMHESGANPDFKPTSATRLEKEMRVTMSQFRNATAKIEAMQLAQSKIERIPRAKAEQTSPEAKPEGEVTVVE